ncbi:MAG: ferrochelatase [Opitutales bacterium]
MAKAGVLLLNLGSPDSTEVADVRKYLEEFLLDERVIDAPGPIRQMIVRGFILPFRPKASAEAYRNIWEEAGSPLITVSHQQKERLAERTGLPVALAMRYRLPRVESAIAELKAAGVERVLIIPLYPHYAMSSYETAVVQAMTALRRDAPEMQAELMQPFYQDADYLDALQRIAEPYLRDHEWDRLQFSFHGIPVRHLRKSDPSHEHCGTPGCCNRPHPAHATCYRHQCLSTVRGLTDRLQLPPEKFGVSFQSRLGRDPWLEPYTDRTLTELPSKGVKKLMVICPAFVTDCLETLEEIRMGGKDLFIEAGGESLTQIPCLNASDACIDFLAGRVERFAAEAKVDLLPNAPMDPLAAMAAT